MKPVHYFLTLFCMFLWLSNANALENAPLKTISTDLKTTIMADGVIDLKDVIMVLKLLTNASPDSIIEKNPSENMARLLRAKSPESFEELIKNWMISHMSRILEDELERALNYECNNYWGWDYFYYDYWALDGIYPVTAALDSPTSLPENMPENKGAEEYSETNNQVAGVDEADFIKNDGSYIYMITDEQLIIIDAWPPDQANIISQFDIQGTPKKLFVHNDRAVVYSAMGSLQDSYYYHYNNECTYGYNCDFTGDGQKLKISVIDISNKAAPSIMRELYFNGSYINSRRIGQAVYTIILFPEPVIPEIRYQPYDRYCSYEYRCYDEFDEFVVCTDYWNEDCYSQYCVPHREKLYSDEELITAFAELEETNKQIIMSAEVTHFQPMVRDIQYIDGQPVEQEKPLNTVENIHFSRQQDGMNFLSIVSFDINEITDHNAVTMIGKPGAVYASPSACYIASRHTQYPEIPWFSFRFWQAADEATTIHKFQLDQSSVTATYIGSGAVKGRVLNQFAMDEHNGFFRIATTSGYSPSPDAHNILSVMKPNEFGNLETVGMIDQIAPSEDIRSVRFNGDQGFIVTFKKTDPLFAVDLSNPLSPTITGELHIPGFSTYIHLLDTDHLLSIGYDSDDQGSFAWFEGVILQIFDISDMSQPSLIHKEVIGTRGTSSEAATNHLAFNFFRPRDLLAVPMAICEGGSGGSYGDNMSFNGLMIYNVTANDGFNYLGGVDHQIEGSCSNWWTNANSGVKRSIFMDDYVYSVAEHEIRIQKVGQFGEDIAVIEW